MGDSKNKEQVIEAWHTRADNGTISLNGMLESFILALPQWEGKAEEKMSEAKDTVQSKWRNDGFL